MICLPSLLATVLFFLSVCVLGFGQLELTGRDASIAADDLSTILHDGLEYAVASVEENRRQAEMSQPAQPKYPASTHALSSWYRAARPGLSDSKLLTALRPRCP